MASTIKSDNGVSSGVTGIVQTADSTGQLALQTTTSGGTATTAITIDNSQNVGVGVTPSAWTNGKGIEVFYQGNYLWSNSVANTFLGTNNYYSPLGFRYVGNYGASNYLQSTGSHIWNIAPSGTAGALINGNGIFTQAMTLDNSGNLMVGGTTAVAYPSQGIVVGTGSSGTVNIGHTSTSSGTTYLTFAYGGSGIGSITQNGTTGVLYNTTSDYRLKNNPVPVTGAKDFVMALQPKTWDWWDGSGKGVGFIAHEFMEVAKYSGHGEKDATKEEEYEVTPAVKDEQGNITTPAVMGTRTVPVYQSIQPSSSEVMANLVAYIQELSAEVTALKAKIGV